MEKTEVDRDQYLLVQLAEGNEAIGKKYLLLHIVG
jgi:hypothetical protein